jgi:hypothetical protein
MVFLGQSVSLGEMMKTEGVLHLSLSPLFALCMDFRKREILLFGTVGTIGGSSSSKDCGKLGKAKVDDFCCSSKLAATREAATGSCAHDNLNVIETNKNN